MSHTRDGAQSLPGQEQAFDQARIDRVDVIASLEQSADFVIVENTVTGAFA